MPNCNLDPKVIKNRERLISINQHWNKQKNLVAQFGWAGGSAEGKNYTDSAQVASDRQIRFMMYETLRDEWNQGLIITDADAKRMKLEIDRLENELRKDTFVMNHVYQMTQLPSMVHSRLPSSKRWLNQTNRSISFERVAREEASGHMANIADFLKAGLVEVGAATKVGASLKVDIINKIRKWEKKINQTEDLNARAEFYQEINTILNTEKGGQVLKDYFELVQMSNADRVDTIRARKGKENAISENVINAVNETKILLGTAKVTGSRKEGDVDVATYKYGKEGGGLGAILIGGLRMAKQVAVETHTNQSDMKSIHVTNNVPLRNLLNVIDAQINSVQKSMADGSYFPHRVFDNVSKLRYMIEKLDSVKGTNDAKKELNEMSDIVSEWTSGETQSSKSRLELLEAMWSRDPMSALDLYMNETLTFNRNTYIKKFFVESFRDLGQNGKITEDTPEFIRGMHKYLEMQYRRATSGFRGRPDWFNSATRTINGVQVMTTMGLGIPGAAQNFLSGYYYHASQGMSVIRRARADMRQDSDLLGTDNRKGILSQSEEKAGFKFRLAGLELVAEGLNPVEGVDLSKVDWVMDDKGKMHIQYDGQSPGGELRSKLFSKAIQKSLVFHRIGENALRKNIWRTAFTHAFMERKNNEIWKDTLREKEFERQRESFPEKDIKFSNDIIQDVWKLEAQKFAEKIAQDAVNTFAYEYSVVNKAPIISGTAPELGADGMPKMGANDYLTGTGSVMFQFMHYPMSFAAHQAKTLKGTYSAFISGQGMNSPDSRNLLGLAGIYGAVALISTATNTDLRRLLPNDTIERLEQIVKSFTGPKGDEAVYGLINQVSGPTLNRLLFWAQVSGALDMPRTDVEHALLGYETYGRMSKSEKERALWNSFHVELSRMRHKTVPALHRGVGIADVAMQEFSLYPTRETREWRKNINDQTKQHLGFRPFHQKFPERKMKPQKSYPRSEVYGAPNAIKNALSEQNLRDLSKYITNLK